MTPGDAALSELKALYLEDEVLIALDVSMYLRDTGFGEVFMAYKLSDAWAEIETETFDVALLDINVDRGQTSLEIGKHLKEQGAAVIFASGNSVDSERLRAKGFHFIDKPFTHQVLEETIHSALAARVR